MARRKRGLGCGGFLFLILILFSMFVSLISISSFEDEEQSATELEETSETETTEEENKETETTEEENEENDEAETEEPEHEEVENTDFSEVWGQTQRRMYQQLNDIEKQLYHRIRECVAENEEGFSVNDIEIQEDALVDTVQKAVNAVYFDFPEYFWWNRAWEAEYRTSGTSVISMSFKMYYYDYWQYVFNKDKYKEKVTKSAEAIASQAAGLSSDYDKVKYVHDYLVRNAEYDMVCYEDRYKTRQKASSQQSHTVYGCLANGLTVCDGYTKTFQMIMNLLGIESEYVEGDAGGGHAWNYLKLDGEEYWMDVTWDDPDYEDYEEAVLYNYFNLTGNEFLTTHTPDKNFEIPECDALKYNYYRHENRYLDSYEFEAFCKALEGQEDFQVVTVRLSDKNEMEEAVNDIFGTGNRYHEIPYFGNIQGSYAYDEEFNIIYIFYE